MSSSLVVLSRPELADVRLRKWATPLGTSSFNIAAVKLDCHAALSLKVLGDKPVGDPQLPAQHVPEMPTATAERLDHLRTKSGASLLLLGS